jgi:hypothetical protein
MLKRSDDETFELGHTARWAKYGKDWLIKYKGYAPTNSQVIVVSASGKETAVYLLDWIGYEDYHHFTFRVPPGRHPSTCTPVFHSGGLV